MKEELRQRIYEKLDLERDMPDEEIMELIEEELREHTKEKAISLKEREQAAKELFDSLRKLDVLQELVDDDSITEIMINGQENIFYEKDGELKPWEKEFASREKLEDVIQQIVGVNNRVVNEASPDCQTGPG